MQEICSHRALLAAQHFPDRAAAAKDGKPAEEQRQRGAEADAEPVIHHLAERPHRERQHRACSCDKHTFIGVDAGAQRIGKIPLHRCLADRCAVDAEKTAESAIGEKNNTPEHHEAACENLYEALVAGIYLDGGLTEAANFIKRTLLTGFRPSKSLKDAYFDTLGAADKNGKSGKNGKAEADKVGSGGDKTPVSNYKGKLQEYVQKNKLGEIVYKEKSKSGPQHSTTFPVEVFVGGEEKGEGSGKKKSEAEQAAARVAILKFTEKSDKKNDGNNKGKNRDGKAKSHSGSGMKAPKTGDKRNGNKIERKKGVKPEKNNRGERKTPQSD